MADRVMFASIHFAFALILILFVSCHSCEEPGPDTEALHLSEAVRNLVRRDVAAAVESEPITTAEVANRYVDVAKNREKRFVALLPLAAPAFGGMTAGTAGAAAAAAVGAGATAAVIASQSSRKGQLPSGQSYHPAPKTGEITGFPGLVSQNPKTPVRGGGGLRKRWKDPASGKIYEWDSQHGELEEYDKRGKHQGSYDPKTGKKKKDAIPDRRIEV